MSVWRSGVSYNESMRTYNCPKRVELVDIEALPKAGQVVEPDSGMQVAMMAPDASVLDEERTTDDFLRDGYSNSKIASCRVSTFD